MYASMRIPLTRMQNERWGNDVKMEETENAINGDERTDKTSKTEGKRNQLTYPRRWQCNLFHL